MIEVVHTFGMFLSPSFGRRVAAISGILVKGAESTKCRNAKSEFFVPFTMCKSDAQPILCPRPLISRVLDVVLLVEVPSWCWSFSEGNCNENG